MPPPRGASSAGAVTKQPHVGGAPKQLRYEGTLDLQGDYRLPGETHSFRSEQHYATDGGGRARLDWIT